MPLALALDISLLNKKCMADKWPLENMVSKLVMPISHQGNETLCHGIRDGTCPRRCTKTMYSSLSQWCPIAGVLLSSFVRIIMVISYKIRYTIIVLE